MEFLNGTISALDQTPRSSYLILATIFFIISAVGTHGNALVILAVCLSRKLQTKTNAFVINLAACDLLLCCSFILNAVGLVHPDGWPFPSIVCYALPMITLLFLSTSIWTLALIALDRFVKITKSSSVYECIYKRRNVSIMLFLLWFLLIPFCLGPLFTNRANTGYNPQLKMCLFASNRSNSGPTGTGIIVSAVMRFVNVVVPVTAILVAYGKIVLHVRRHVRRVRPDPNVGPGARRAVALNQATEGADDMNDSGNDVDNSERAPPPRPMVRQPFNHWVDREIRIAKNLALVTAVFFGCYIPMLTMNTNMSFLHMSVALSLTCCNSSLNPLIYAAKYPVFGKVFRCILTGDFRSIPDPSRQLRILLTLE